MLLCNYIFSIIAVQHATIVYLVFFISCHTFSSTIQQTSNFAVYTLSLHWCFVVNFGHTFWNEHSMLQCTPWLLSLDCIIIFLTKHGWFLSIAMNKKAHFMLLVFLINAWYNHKNMVLPLFFMVYIIHMSVILWSTMSVILLSMEEA